SLPCCGQTRFAAVASENSLVVATFQAIDRKSSVTNQFALSNALNCRLELYRSGAATYDRQPSREWDCLATESVQERDDGAGIFSNFVGHADSGLRGQP